MRSFLFAAAAVAVLAAGAGQACAQQVEVTVAQGRLAGSTAGSISSFKGIPFAAPPVGDLRWRPPASPKSWTGVRNATRFGHSCLQPAWPGSGEEPDQSEDCLTLNVWKPAKAKAGAKLPVMVWIYGGGMFAGTSASPLYDGSRLAQRGVILVSFNYRLGNLGFFAHPALTAENPTGQLGNFGVMDVAAALRWVKANISAFGGDPANVTIFGQSAGGIMVNIMMTSPLGKGLFAKAISQSGRGRLGLAPIRGEEAATGENIGLAFARQHGVDGPGADTARALRALPADQLVKLATGIGTARAAWPMIDGQVVLGNPSDAFAAGTEAKVPYLAGSNSWEASNMGAVVKDPERTLAGFGPLRQELMAVYGEDTAGAAQDVKGDALFTEPVRAYARLHIRHGAPAYTYHFSYLPPALRGVDRGAGHAGELPLLFGTLTDRGAEVFGKKYPPATPADAKMSAAMIGYWTNFAKTGRPSVVDGVAWPQTLPDDSFLEFGSDGVHVRPHFQQKRLDALVGIPERQRLP